MPTNDEFLYINFKFFVQDYKPNLTETQLKKLYTQFNGRKESELLKQFISGNKSDFRKLIQFIENFIENPRKQAWSSLTPVPPNSPPPSVRRQAWGTSPRSSPTPPPLPSKPPHLRQPQPTQEASLPGAIDGGKKKKLTVKELKKIAKDRKIKGYSKMNKAELEKILKKKKK